MGNFWCSGKWQGAAERLPNQPAGLVIEFYPVIPEFGPVRIGAPWSVLIKPYLGGAESTLAHGVVSVQGPLTVNAPLPSIPGTYNLRAVLDGVSAGNLPSVKIAGAPVSVSSAEVGPGVVTSQIWAEPDPPDRLPPSGPVPPEWGAFGSGLPSGVSERAARAYVAKYLDGTLPGSISTRAVLAYAWKLGIVVPGNPSDPGAWTVPVNPTPVYGPPPPGVSVAPPSGGAASGLPSPVPASGGLSGMVGFPGIAYMPVSVPGGEGGNLAPAATVSGGAPLDGVEWIAQTAGAGSLPAAVLEMQKFGPSDPSPAPGASLVYSASPRVLTGMVGYPGMSIYELPAGGGSLPAAMIGPSRGVEDDGSFRRVGDPSTVIVAENTDPVSGPTRDRGLDPRRYRPESQPVVTAPRPVDGGPGGSTWLLVAAVAVLGLVIFKN